jgi:hypothetical protein
MGQYRKIWEDMGIVVKDYTDQEVDHYVESFLAKTDFEAYRNLVPMCLRTDIWRLCVLYREGGIYSDIHIKPLSSINGLFDKAIDHVFVIDTMSDTRRAYNAFMMAKPGSMLIWKVLQRAMLHIRERIYPHNVLDITGPGVLGFVLRRALDQKDQLIEGVHHVSEGSVILFSHVNQLDSGQKQERIVYEETPVFQCRYPEYRNEMVSIGAVRYQYYFYHRIIYEDDLRSVRRLIMDQSYIETPISLERITLETELYTEYS